MPRNYSYDTAYESTPLQKKRRAARNAARRTMLKEGKVTKGSDVDHIKRNLSGNLSNSPGNLRAQPASVNRSRNSPKK